MEVREPAVAYGKRKFTVEEYLEMEDAATEKHEYYRGEIFAMSGAKLNHNRIVTNVLISLGQKLNDSSCQPYGSDLRIHVEKNSLFTYPDISVFCDEPQSRNNDEMNFINPSMIIEVLSPSTRRYDRNEKFTLYKDIPSLRTYTIIDSENIGIEVWHLAGQIWDVAAYKAVSDVIELPNLNITLLASEIYKGTKLT